MSGSWPVRTPSTKRGAECWWQNGTTPAFPRGSWLLTSIQPLQALAAQSEAPSSYFLREIFLTVTSGSTFSGGTPYWGLNAYVIDPGSDDYVALADHKPTGPLDYLRNQWQWAVYLDKDGSYITGTSPSTIHKWPGWGYWCLDVNKLSDYWILYGTKKNGSWQLIDYRQFVSNSTWMADIAKHIENQKLYNIVIPGTHDSGTIYPTIDPYAVSTQNMDFRGQLDLGLRYFDCRLQAFPNDSTDHF